MEIPKVETGTAYQDYIDVLTNRILQNDAGLKNYPFKTAQSLARQRAEYEYEFTHGGFSSRSLAGAEPLGK